MKIRFVPVVAGMLCWSLVCARAQFGGMGGMGKGSQMSGVTTKLMGKDAAFTANVEMETSGTPGGQAMFVPGKLSVDHGKARFETDLAEMKGGGMPPGAAAQMKAMGMDKMVIISRPDQKLTYLVYPGLKSYVANPADADTTDELKMETTDLGKETFQGHACVKLKAVVTDKEGKKHEATVWKAADLKDLPVKIVQIEENVTITMTLKNVSLGQPEAKLFEAPSEGTKFDNVMALMQSAMQKQMTGVQGAPAAASRPPQQ